jgi:hypothetical protein
MSGVCVAAIKITLKNSIGIFVLTGKNRQDILDKAFAELEIKIAALEKKEIIDKSEPILQPVLSPYLFA